MPTHEVYDMVKSREGELLIGTNNGFWASNEDGEDFRNIESLSSDVKVVWESYDGGSRRLFRAGDKGLYVTVTFPLSRAIIVYSGETGSARQIKFSWGDLIGPNDGGWSDHSMRQINISDWLSPSAQGALQEYKGWDRALIVRSGPFSTYEKSEIYAANQKMFAPMDFVMYPDDTMTNNSNFVFGTSPIFQAQYTGRTGYDTHYLEEYRNINLVGGFAWGSTYDKLDPPRTRQFFQDGNIIVGQFPNVDNDNFPNGVNWPSTDAPMIDSVIPPSTRLVGDNYADISAYGSGETLEPTILENKFYIYRVYPFRMIPLSWVLTESGTYPTFPRYIPNLGDSVDSYSYIIGIEKFEGASTILSGETVFGNNWMVGTDSGLFYSTDNGRDVNKSENLAASLVNYNFVSIFYTSNNVVLAVATSNSSGDIRLVRNSSDLIESDFDSNWEYLNDVTIFFTNSGINTVFNMVEIGGSVYSSTNAGVAKCDISGENWEMVGRVGYLEGVGSQKVLGQEFIVS
jgi:hypothetical protein